MLTRTGSLPRLIAFTRLMAMATLHLTMSANLKAESPPPSLTGTWELERAEISRPDGTVVVDPNYGPDAQGLLIIDREGRYSLQIVRPGRPKFATADKTRGTPEEYRSALLGLSTHAGRISIDASAHKLVFSIELAAFPNWENTQQVRDYRLSGTQLSYQLPPGPSGTSAISVWRRVSGNR